MGFQNPHLLARLGLDPEQGRTELSGAVSELLDDCANLDGSAFWSSLKWSHQEGVERIQLFAEIWMAGLFEDYCPYLLLKFNGTNLGLLVRDGFMSSGEIDALGAVDLEKDIGAQVESILGAYFKEIDIGVPSGLLFEATGIVDEAALRNAYWHSDCCRSAGKQAFETEFREAVDYGKRQKPNWA